MKLITRFLYLPAACIVLLASCAKEQTESYDKFEDQALEAYMTQKHPELLENLQTDGGYYVDILEPGKADAKPVNDTICWVKFDFSGRDLSGNIALTRRANEAYQLGTFTKYTHYVPYYRYCGEANAGLIEGTYLAMRNTLYLGEEYIKFKKDTEGFDLDPEFLLREGAKVRLYMPSRVVGSGGISGDGGYEGQYSLSAKRPLIMEMEVVGIDKNPLEAEGSLVDAFAKENGGMVMFTKDGEDGSEKRPTDPEDGKHPYNRAERWVSACDTVAQLYVNVKYDPVKTGKGDKFSFDFSDAESKVSNKPYNVGFEPYNGSDLEKEISEALKKRFHGEGDDYKAYEGVDKLESDSVGLDGTAKIWYIGRFLDGFIFDTNIDEVKKIIYGEVTSEGSAYSYTPESGGLITAFYYTVPNLRYGQWAAFVTTSTNAYGTSGKSGSSTSSPSGNGYSSNYLDYLNYLNYSQMYYGNSGLYGGYYGDYYGYGGLGGYGYGYGYYGNYGYDYGSTDNTSTTTTVTTEIPSFAPLIFQFYIEPAED